MTPTLNRADQLALESMARTQPSPMPALDRELTQAEAMQAVYRAQAAYYALGVVPAMREHQARILTTDRDTATPVRPRRVAALAVLSAQLALTGPGEGPAGTGNMQTRALRDHSRGARVFTCPQAATATANNPIRPDRRCPDGYHPVY